MNNEQTQNTDTIKEAFVQAEKEVSTEKIKSTQNTTTVQLPSNGLMNPNITEVTLRRMTTLEFKTLHTSKDPNYLTNLLMSCIVDPVNIQTTDLHPNDIIYLLFILRYISTPNNLTERFRCPLCQEVFDTDVKIQDLDVKYYKDTPSNVFSFTFPECGDKIEFRILSEGDIINTEKVANRQVRTHKLEGAEAEWHVLISKVAYQLLTKNDLEFETFQDKVKFLESLSAYDFESYQEKYNEIIKTFGLQMNFITTCDKCKEDVEVQAYIAPDFFRLV